MTAVDGDLAQPRVALIAHSTSRGAGWCTRGLADAAPGRYAGARAGPRRSGGRPVPGHRGTAHGAARRRWRHPRTAGVRCHRHPGRGPLRAGRPVRPAARPGLHRQPGGRWVRDSGRPGLRVLRTVHHVDDFSTRALIDCQRQAIVEPDRVLVVSEQWRGILRDEYGRAADVVPNGVDPDRLAAPPADYRAALRALIGATDRFLFLAVGGVEPRRHVHAFAALARLRRAGVNAMLAVVGNLPGLHRLPGRRPGHPARSRPGPGPGRGAAGHRRRAGAGRLVPQRGRAVLPVGEGGLGLLSWRPCAPGCR